MTITQELIRIENSLAFVRASSTHHSVIDVEILESMIRKLKTIYTEGQILDLEIRDYYDIIKPGSYYVDKQIIFVFKFPIFSKNTYDFRTHKPLFHPFLSLQPTRCFMCI